VTNKQKIGIRCQTAENTKHAGVTRQIFKCYVLVCGNKMKTRCNRWFLLQILLLAQHVSGPIMPIIRSSRILYSWLPSVVFGAWFSSCRYGGELRVVCPVCGLLQQQQLENQAPKTTGGNQPYNTLDLLMMGIMVSETCWASNKICNKKICCI
jgi:hypothetical protein